MIARDQPTIFPDTVIVRVSSVRDGTMSLKSLPDNPEKVWRNRRKFIEKCGGGIESTALVYVTYDDTRTYTEYKLAEAVGVGLSTTDDDVADGLATREPGPGLFLPVADCCAVVLYDVKHKALVLSHIGRHTAERYGAVKSLEFMKAQFDTHPKDVIAWLSPAVGADTYPILQRDSKSLKECIVEDLCDTGVTRDNIEISPVDTAKDSEYFSHSEYRKGNRQSDGRFAVFAMVKTTTVQ